VKPRPRPRTKVGVNAGARGLKRVIPMMVSYRPGPPSIPQRRPRHSHRTAESDHAAVLHQPGRSWPISGRRKDFQSMSAGVWRRAHEEEAFWRLIPDRRAPTLRQPRHYGSRYGANWKTPRITLILCIERRTPSPYQNRAVLRALRSRSKAICTPRVRQFAPLW